MTASWAVIRIVLLLMVYSIYSADIPQPDYPRNRTMIALDADETAIAYQVADARQKIGQLVLEMGNSE